MGYSPNEIFKCLQVCDERGELKKYLVHIFKFGLQKVEKKVLILSPSSYAASC